LRCSTVLTTNSVVQVGLGILRASRRFNCLLQVTRILDTVIWVDKIIFERIPIVVFVGVRGRCSARHHGGHVVQQYRTISRCSSSCWAGCTAQLHGYAREAQHETRTAGTADVRPPSSIFTCKPLRWQGEAEFTQASTLRLLDKYSFPSRGLLLYHEAGLFRLSRAIRHVFDLKLDGWREIGPRIYRFAENLDDGVGG
ncbi:hypothetical protein KCU83_g208, partial [Aureobasidium melanogenum]